MLRQRLTKICIIFFCLWHMAAVGIWSIPKNFVEIPFLRTLQKQRPYFSPYVLTTYQWQNWNLFSPDPLRKVTDIRIDTNVKGKWVTLRTLDGDHLGFFRRAPELKYMGKIKDAMPKLKNAYMHDICRTDRLSPETRIRMRQRSFVIPKPSTLGSIAKWRAWKPRWSKWTIDETVCNPLPS